MADRRGNREHGVPGGDLERERFTEREGAAIHHQCQRRAAEAERGVAHHNAAHVQSDCRVVGWQWLKNEAEDCRYLTRTEAMIWLKNFGGSRRRAKARSRSCWAAETS